MSECKITELLSFTDVDYNSLTITIRARPEEPDAQVRFTVCGHDIDLNVTDVRCLQNWLTDWLGDKPQHGYTDEDVDRLVKLAQEIRGDITNAAGLPVEYDPSWVTQSFDPILDPFLPPPDPDKELIEKMIQADSASAYTNSAVDTMRALLAVVRAHDKEQTK